MRNKNIKTMQMIIAYGGSFKTYRKVDRKNLKHVPARKLKRMWSRVQFNMYCYDDVWLELMLLKCSGTERNIVKDVIFGQRYGSNFVEETLTALKEITIGY